MRVAYCPGPTSQLISSMNVKRIALLPPWVGFDSLQPLPAIRNSFPCGSPPLMREKHFSSKGTFTSADTLRPVTPPLASAGTLASPTSRRSLPTMAVSLSWVKNSSNFLGFCSDCCRVEAGLFAAQEHVSSVIVTNAIKTFQVCFDSLICLPFLSQVTHQRWVGKNRTTRHLLPHCT